MLKQECSKILVLYEDVIENPYESVVQNELTELINRIDGFIDQLPYGVREGVRDALTTHMSTYMALGMCYAVFGVRSATSELLKDKMLSRLEDIDYDNEFVMDSFPEFLSSLCYFVYYTYTNDFSQYVDTDSFLTIIINNLNVVMDESNTYNINDIELDLDEFLSYTFPENYESESTFYNMLNPNLGMEYYSYDIWGNMIKGFRDGLNDLLTIPGFIFTEGNRSEVCKYIKLKLAKSFYQTVYNIDIDSLYNIEAIECAKKIIFNYPGHIDSNNIFEELLTAVAPQIDLFFRIVLKITYVVNTNFVNYPVPKMIECILKLKGGFENEVYYNSSIRKTFRRTRFIPCNDVQRNYTGAKQYIHASQSR